MEEEITSEESMTGPTKTNSDQVESQAADERLSSLKKLHRRLVGDIPAEASDIGDKPGEYDSVDDVNLRELKRGDKFVVTTGRYPELSKSVYTVNVTGVRKDGLRVTVKDEVTRKGATSVDEFTARLVGEHVKTEATDRTVGMSFEGVKYQKSEFGFLGAKAHRVAQIQSIQLRRRQ